MIKRFLQKIHTFWNTVPFLFRILFCAACITAALLAIRGLQTGIIFSFDQARDAIESYSIWHDFHIKILGPSTDIPGVFHGVLWYYLLAIVYAIGKTPEFVAAAFCVFLFLTVPIVGVLTESLFGNKKTTVIAMVLYMLTPLFQTSSRWLSNPIPSFLVSPLLLLLLWKFIKKPSFWMAVSIGVGYGIMIQAEFAYVLLLVTVPVFWLLLRLRVRLKDIGGFIAGLVISIGSFFIAEVKFHGQGIKGMEAFLKEGSPHHTFLVTLSQMWDRMTQFFAVTMLSYPMWLIGVVMLVILGFALWQLRGKNKNAMILLLIWVGALLMFLLSGTGIATSYFLFFPFVVAVVVIVSFFLTTMIKNSLLLVGICLLIIIGQTRVSFFYITSNTSPLPAQQGATLNYEKQIINYTYQASHGQKFTIVTITNPLYIDTTWAYLYSEYGLPKYGYVPNYGGRGQTGIFGENLLPEVPFATHFRYLILEPPDGLATIYITKITYEEERVSDIVETKHIGRYIIEKRVLHGGKTPPPIPAELIGKPILTE